MSSILKALKKLERELQDKKGVQLWSRSADTQKAVANIVRGNRYLGRPLEMLLAVAFLSVSGLTIGSHLPLLEKKVKPRNETASRSFQISRPRENSMPQIPHARKEAPKTSNPPVNKPQEPVPPKIEQTVTKKEERGTLSEDNPQRVTAQKPITRQESAEKLELNLQAIAWSKDPKGRIAVINNRVIREGGSIEGFSVVRIAMDEVSVQKGGKEWKLNIVDHKK